MTHQDGLPRCEPGRGHLVLAAGRGTATAPIDHPATMPRHRDITETNPHHHCLGNHPSSSPRRRTDPAEASSPSAPVPLPRRGNPECPSTSDTDARRLKADTTLTVCDNPDSFVTCMFGLTAHFATAPSTAGPPNPGSCSLRVSKFA